MISVNRVTLIGRLGQDPEIRYLENGVAVGRFSLATSERYRDKDGNWQDRPTEWHNVVVWRYLAEKAEKELKKGMAVYVEGQINYRSYDDKDGIQRKTVDIIARTIQPFVDNREGGGHSAQNFPPAENDPFANRSEKPAAPKPAAPVKQDKPVVDNSSDGDEMGDDLPF